MSRITKFRVWEPTLNKFFYSPSPFERSWMSEDGVDTAYGVNTLDIESFGRAAHEYNLFTGWENRVERLTELTDKNGEKVYEGDILRYVSDTLILVFLINERLVNGRSVIPWIKENSEWTIKYTKGIQDASFGIKEMAFSIKIGNIRENPNFLYELYPKI